MPEKTWKRVERWYCRDLGGERTGPMGDHLPDCTRDTAPFSVEVKHRARLPKWLLEMVEQAVDESYAGMIPIVILHPKHALMGDALVIMPYDSFKEAVHESSSN